MTTRWHPPRPFGAITVLTVLAAGGGLRALAAPETPSGPRYEGFVLVRGGAFEMGDLWGDGPFAMREVPVHDVRVGDFLVS